MLPLFDMMLQAQNGNAMDAMARQFGLAQEQAAKAMAALTPAFASGFKRNTANPYDFSALLSAMSSGNYARYFEDMSSAFTPQGIADGNQVLQQLFGSKEVSRAIAAQAAQLTGIGQDILKQMMPVMADTMMGGLFKQATGQFGGANAFTASPMAAMMQQWLESTGLQPKPQPQADTMFDNPFTRAFQEMMGGSKKPEPQAQANPFLENPFAKAFQDMAAAYTGQTAAQPEASKPEASKAPGKDAGEGFAAMINTMFDSGLEVQKSYQKSMEQIFDTYLTASKGETAADNEPPAPKG
ncbi:hypothetical protein ASE36_04925 [Rhizobium sp. Root274]|uniref:DUF937 domain-containing protein n=1 Tax=unclassified Rhizobium TaxID=2613769 RepID=UPI0007150C73|nr:MULTISPECIES: DUF937 domain-containing protein [unclassified Rhizobium]KQW31585.1 hypothetical protein ASC71_04930 [Rhizobium sp. Root1240]KRD33125.1 hypothetical protein ASE36_04925 [Rhizobium sp. Root274]